MKINSKTIIWAIKIIVWLVFASIIIFLTLEKLAPGGQVVYRTDFSGRERFIQNFYPKGKMNLVNGFALVSSEPVYLDVYSPKKFSRAKAKIVYSSPNLEAKFGVKLNVNAWGFYFEEMPPTGDGFKEITLEFNLAKAEIANNKLKFAIACPGVDAEKNLIMIDSIEITLTK